MKFKHLKTFEYYLTETNTSDINRNSYLESIMKKMSLSTFKDDVKVDKGDYYYILSNDYINNGDYIYNLKSDRVSKLQDGDNLMSYMAYANTYTTKKIKSSNNPNIKI